MGTMSKETEKALRDALRVHLVSEGYLGREYGVIFPDIYRVAEFDRFVIEARITEKPKMVTTVEELRELPVGTVLVHPDEKWGPFVYEKAKPDPASYSKPDAVWLIPGSGDTPGTHEEVELPAMVAYTP